MANTYIMISSTVLNTTTASVTLSSIPQTYTDLKLFWSTRTPNTTPTTDNIIFRMNGSSSNGTVKILYTTTGTTVFSNSDTAIYDTGGTVGGAATANTYSNGELYIPNYTSSNFKSMSMDSVAENNATAAGLGLAAGLWSQTAAITSIDIVPNFANFSQYSSFTLYGIKNS